MSTEKRQDMYRMPTVFGPATGPRRGPDGRIFDCIDSPQSTILSVGFLSAAEQLSALLPDRFEVAGAPVVTVTLTCMKQIDWLAGRGYNMLGVSFPARFAGDRDTVTGTFLTVLWENLTEPILTGREELGFAKIYCDLPDPTIADTTASAAASWMGFEFMQLELTDLSETASDAPISQTHQADPSAESPSEGILHYKYMPRTGEWGTSDCEYAVLTPATGSHARQLRHSSGQGRVMWNRARWEDMPTQYNIVNGIADLEVRQWLGATITETVGGKDLSDQRILR